MAYHNVNYVDFTGGLLANVFRAQLQNVPGSRRLPLDLPIDMVPVGNDTFLFQEGGYTRPGFRQDSLVLIFADRARYNEDVLQNIERVERFFPTNKLLIVEQDAEGRGLTRKCWDDCHYHMLGTNLVQLQLQPLLSVIAEVVYQGWNVNGA